MDALTGQQNILNDTERLYCNTYVYNGVYKANMFFKTSPNCDRMTVHDASGQNLVTGFATCVTS